MSALGDGGKPARVGGQGRSMRQVERASIAEPPVAGRAFPTLRFVALVPLLLLLRPYRGIVQDARIYLGRALADLDPAGLGRDLMFAMDEQTGFTVTRPLFRALVGAVPLHLASAGIAVVGLLAWLVALVALLRRLTDERSAWASAVAVLVLPAGYGTPGIFYYAEAIATPRIFAEAAVLAGLAALLSRRTGMAAALLLLAAAFHPLMALPGIVLAGSLWLWRTGRAKRLAAAAAVLAVAAAAAAGAPVIGRLFTLMDPTWFGIVRDRSAYLFPVQWSAEAYETIAAQAAAAIVAASLLGGAGAGPGPRAVLYGAVSVAVGGVLLALLPAEYAPSVLLLQVQPWRALWLLSVLGNAGLAIAAARLWRGGAWSRLVLALLILGVAMADAVVPSLLCALAAVALRLADAAGRLPAVPPRIGTFALVGALLVAVAGTAAEVTGVVRLSASLGPGRGTVPLWPYVVGAGALAFPLLGGALALALAPSAWLRTPGARIAGAVAVAGLSIAAGWLWDARSDEERMIEARAGAAELDAALGPGPGGVLWIDDNNANWFFARRPAYFNVLQGAPVLFSRALAIEWSGRGRLLERLGLVQPNALQPWAAIRRPDPDIVPSAGAITAFCADARQPAGIVAPGDQLAAVPPGLSARLWRPAAQVGRMSFDDSGPRWRPIAVYTVVNCHADGASVQR